MARVGSLLLNTATRVLECSALSPCAQLCIAMLHAVLYQRRFLHISACQVWSSYSLQAAASSGIFSNKTNKKNWQDIVKYKFCRDMHVARTLAGRCPAKRHSVSHVDAHLALTECHDQCPPAARRSQPNVYAQRLLCLPDGLTVPQLWSARLYSTGIQVIQ